MTVFSSTIIPTIGRPTLARAVESVLSQRANGFDFEVIVVNDSGKPLSISEWRSSEKVQVLETLQKERCLARNAGAEAARGRFFHFLDDDDWLLPGALSRLHQLAANSYEAWLYGSTQLVDREGRKLITLKHSLEGNCAVEAMAGEWMPLQSSIIKAKVFQNLGGFDPNAVGAEDVDLFRRFTMVGDLAGTAEPVSCVEIGEEGGSTDFRESLHRSRAARERMLNDPQAFGRLCESVSGPNWQGRLVRTYLTSMMWNLRRLGLGMAANRFAQALKAFLFSSQSLFSLHFWWSLATAYESETFLNGFKEADLCVERRPRSRIQKITSKIGSVPAAKPLVSIGLPVYNGEDYLVQTLDSILSQSFADLELVISDNASTDLTQEICRNFASRDVRIRYFRNEENIGAARNFNRVFELSRGEYFRWACHDDPLGRALIEQCAKVLNDEPDIIMAYGRTVLIDGNDQLIEYHEDRFDIMEHEPHERLRRSFRSSGWCHQLYGLFRSRELKKTSLMGSYPSADKVLLNEIALVGKCFEVPEFNSYRRIHSGISTVVHATDEAMAIFMDPTAEKSLVPPRLRRFLEIAKAIWRIEMMQRERFLCFVELLRFYVAPGRVRGVGKDLLHGFRRLMGIGST